MERQAKATRAKVAETVETERRPIPNTGFREYSEYITIEYTVQTTNIELYITMRRMTERTPLSWGTRSLGVSFRRKKPLSV